MEPTCVQCHNPIEDNGAGDWIHKQSQDTYCPYRHTHDPSNRPVAKPAGVQTKLVDDRPSLLGCPSCGSTNLHQGVVCYEPIELYSDGNVEFPGSFDDYGPSIVIGCDNCSWRIGANDRELETVKPEQVIAEHQRLVREEFLKEVRDT